MEGNMLNAMKYISIVPFSGLFNWDVKIILGDNIISSKKHPMKPFSYFTRPANIQKVKIEDEQEYKILGVRSYGLGAYKNRITKGKYLKMKVYQQAKLNHLFWCKVDTKNGAFGIISQELSDGIASSNMMFAELDLSRINPDYFQILFRWAKINTYMASMVPGTTNRKYIRFSELLNNVKVPVPSLEEQNKLVEEYNKQLAIAADAELLAIKKHRNINSLLFSELGVKISKDNVLNGLSTVAFSALDRWDIAYLQNTAKYTAKYKSLRFENCIEHFMKGFDGKSLRMETYKTPTRDFHYIGMEHIEKATGQLIDAPIVKGSQIKSQTVTIPNGYFIYGKLRPYLNKYWYNNTNWDNIVCSSELFVFRIKDTINTRFFEVVLGSDIIQEQIADLTSGARMPRITEEVFMNIHIPIPPLHVQKDLADQIDKITNEIKELRNSALQKRTDALGNFETQVFE